MKNMKNSKFNLKKNLFKIFEKERKMLLLEYKTHKFIILK